MDEWSRWSKLCKVRRRRSVAGVVVVEDEFQQMAQYNGNRAPNRACDMLRHVVEELNRTSDSRVSCDLYIHCLTSTS